MSYVAAAYRRVSTFEQSRGFSPEAQKADIAALVQQLGVELEYDWEDTDSGAGWDLPGLNSMLQAARAGKFQLLVLTDPDRLARNFVKQLVIEEELRKLGVKIRYVNLKVDDSAEGRLMTNMRASFAEYEREKIRMRTSRGRRAKAERGMIVGSGAAPFGYQYVRDATDRIIGMEPHPINSLIIKEIFYRAKTQAVKDISSWLRETGIPTGHRGSAWYDSTVWHILRNRLYLGEYRYGGALIPVPSIISAETFTTVARGMKHRKKARVARGDGPDPYLLRGRLVCGHCGGYISTAITTTLHRYYQCLRAKAGKCPLPSLPKAPLEALAWSELQKTLRNESWLKRAFADARKEKGVSQSIIETLQREVTKMRARLTTITSERMDAVRGSETARVLDELQKQTALRLDEMMRELSTLESQAQQIPDARDVARAIKLTKLYDARQATVPDRIKIQQYSVMEWKMTMTLGETYQIGKHHYDIEWGSWFTICDSDRALQKYWIRW